MTAMKAKKSRQRLECSRLLELFEVMCPAKAVARRTRDRTPNAGAKFKRPSKAPHCPEVSSFGQDFTKALVEKRRSWEDFQPCFCVFREGNFTLFRRDRGLRWR